MNAVPLLSTDDKIVRTQVTLTESLRELIEKQHLASGESLSAYLRRAALLSLILDAGNKLNLKNLADRVIGAVNSRNHPEWQTKTKVQAWQRKIRSEWTI